MIKMPWTDASAPNAMIEVVDACNVECRVCYRRKSARIKPMEEIRRDLDAAKRLRKLHTVTITGGEPTLHPELCEIVRMIKEQGFHVFLLTNGLVVDREYLRPLKDAGLDSILFHVDEGQAREDLPPKPGFRDVRKRLDELIVSASAERIDVSVSTTVYEWEQLQRVTDYFLAHPDISFLFLSRAVDCRSFFRDRAPESGPPMSGFATQGVRHLVDFFRRRHELEPFSYIPTQGGGKTVWVSYFVPVVFGPDGYSTFRYRSTWIDAAAMRLMRMMTGRYIHKTSQNPRLTWTRIALNAASRFRPGPAARFWKAAGRPGRTLRHKMIVYDDGPYWLPGGEMERCEYCPTAIVRGGALVPCCSADFGTEVVSHASAS